VTVRRTLERTDAQPQGITRSAAFTVVPSTEETMAAITARAETVISRPIAIVRDQFVDLHHHEATRVHIDLEVSNVRPAPGGCRFTGRRRVLGMRQEDEIEVQRSADGNSTLRSLSGSNAGLLIEQRFESVDAGSTRVQTTVTLPVRGLMVLMAPLLRIGLRRDLVTALEEDRRDLEENGYQGKL